MANEIHARAPKASSSDYYGVIEDYRGYFWNATDGVFEEGESGNWTDYAIALAETVAGSYHYYADFPAAISDGLYLVRFYESEEDADPVDGDDAISGIEPQSLLWRSGSAVAETSAGVIGWTSIAEADDYLTKERPGGTTYWPSTSAEKSALLHLAWRTLSESEEFDLPGEWQGSNESLRRAQCEQALFLARDQDGMDARLALQAQGVRSAGVVSEGYVGVSRAPVCATARTILTKAGYRSRSPNIITREPM